jgi:dUTP pyrophosphatase
MSSIKFKKLHPGASIPRRHSELAIGLDLHAFCLDTNGRTNHVIVAPHSTRTIPTGIAIEPIDCYVFVCSRSGLASKSLFVANAPGIIDPDYRGEIKVLLFNGGHETAYIRHEDRIAQLIPFQHSFPIETEEVEELTPTERGTSGFGSTGR